MKKVIVLALLFIGVKGYAQTAATPVMAATAKTPTTTTKVAPKQTLSIGAAGNNKANAPKPQAARQPEMAPAKSGVKNESPK